MNYGLRWLLVLGCLSIVFLEAPQDLLQVLEDSSGAYPAQAASALTSASTDTPSSVRILDADDDAESIDELVSPSPALTKLERAADPIGSVAPSRATSASARSEGDFAHEPRDERSDSRAEFALRR